MLNVYQDQGTCNVNLGWWRNRHEWHEAPDQEVFHVIFNVHRCSFQHSSSGDELQKLKTTGSLELALTSKQLTTPDKHKISRWNDSIHLYCKVTHRVVTLPRWLISWLILGPCVNSSQVSFIYIAGNLSHSTIFSVQHRSSVICSSSNCHQFIIYIRTSVKKKSAVFFLLLYRLKLTIECWTIICSV